MSSHLFLTLIFGSILQCIYDIFIVNRISKQEAKKANYNCNNCQNWKCFYFNCKKEREKLQVFSKENNCISE